MKNIFREGLNIPQEDGSNITLTAKDVMYIRYMIEAQYGRDSLEFFIEEGEDYIEWCRDLGSFDEESFAQIKKEIKVAKESLENDIRCREIYRNYYDVITMGDEEFDTVKSCIDCWIREEEI